MMSLFLSLLSLLFITVVIPSAAATFLPFVVVVVVVVIVEVATPAAAAGKLNSFCTRRWELQHPDSIAVLESVIVLSALFVRSLRVTHTAVSTKLTCNSYCSEH